jgi:shikimate dehydrogenase
VSLKAGVIGHPISHSKSPAIHRAWIAALGMDASYDAYDVAPEGLADFIARHRGGAGLRGVNVTIPHKEQSLALADAADAAAGHSGAANVLLFKEDGTIEARNTDGLGMLAAFKVAAPAFDPRTARVLVLGAGGAARGAVAALVAAGAAEVTIANRTLSRAQDIADAFSGAVKAVSGLAISSDADVVINATSLGLTSQGFRLAWPPARRGAMALDMVYGPSITDFLADAAAQGWATVEGIEMLIGQAAPSFEAFYGVAPPADYRALALKACA